MIGLEKQEMKIHTNFKKYDFVKITLNTGTVENCLVYDIDDRGITFLPIEKYVKTTELPQHIARIYMLAKNIVSIEKENLTLLFYAVNTKNKFVREALEYHMKNEAESRKNKAAHL